MTPIILSLILQYSALYGVDPQLVMAVIQIESKYDVNAVGGHGEIGLMQLLPASFSNYNRKQLFDPKFNLFLGIKHLADVRNECKHKEDKTWVVCYNLGSPKGNRIKHPKLFPYYKKVYPLYRDFKGVSMFIPGQKVIVLKALSGGGDAEGTIIRKIDNRIGFNGQFQVDLGDTNMPVSADRLITIAQYQERHKEQTAAISNRMLSISPRRTPSGNSSR